MNLIFLTLVKIYSLEERGIYHDLLRKFRDEGHNVYVVTPTERRDGKNTKLIALDGIKILTVKTLNIQKTNIIEKGVGTLAIEYQYLKAIKKYFKDIKFDLVLYSTPPITLAKVILYLKKRDSALTYLLLKDIFPQNAVDMKMMKKGGFLYKAFVKKEKKLYRTSDYIGCMSPANKEFLLKNNPEIDSSIVEVNPNTIKPIESESTEDERKYIRNKYKLPLDKKIFVYGGNLGKSQGVEFLLQTINCASEMNAYFLIVGSGTMYSFIEKWFALNNPKNATLLSGLPKSDYDKLLKVCDVGMIFLHKDFTIPNFPSRFLSYLEMKMPVLAATDVNTDIGKIIVENNCGFWVESGEIELIKEKISTLISDDILFHKMKYNSFELLKKEYKVDVSYELINSKLINV